MNSLAEGTLQSPSDDIIYPSTIPFILVHIACIGIIWTGITWQSLTLCVSLYVIRMFAVTAGYHRYFSHRSFKTSRVFQFILALMCQTAAQKGILWWASKHRDHHLHSDTEADTHSPRQHGLLFSHIGWIYSIRKGTADYSNIPDLTCYPELVWLDRTKHMPAVFLGIGIYLVFGWIGLFAGFFLSTVFLYHGTFAINSLAHVLGNQRYYTGDDSRNNFFLALITLGEGWHNNHHYYMASVRQGFFWWEIDLTYYGLKVLSWFHIVWDLRVPPHSVIRGERRLNRATIEKAALRLCETTTPHEESQALRARALTLFGNTPSLDDILQRSKQLRQAEQTSA